VKAERRKFPKFKATSEVSREIIYFIFLKFYFEEVIRERSRVLSQSLLNSNKGICRKSLKLTITKPLKKRSKRKKRSSSKLFK
jgi:hypothetical protein